MIYYIYCGVLLIILGSLQAFFGILLITPRDVGGTLFGGMFLDLLFLSVWLIVTSVLIILILIRFAGAILALLCTSVIQMVAGVLALLNYPDDINGNLIFTPTPHEINLMLALIGMLFIACIYLIKSGRFHHGSVD